MVCWHSARKPRSSGVSAAYQAWPVHVPFGYANLAGLLAKLNLHPAQVPRGGGASPFRAVRLQPFLAAAHRGPCQRSLDLNFRAQQTAAALALCPLRGSERSDPCPGLASDDPPASIAHQCASVCTADSMANQRKGKSRYQTAVPST